MKYYFLPLVLLLLAKPEPNLVPNGGFEEVTRLHYYQMLPYGNMGLLKHWKIPNRSTTDYFRKGENGNLKEEVSLFEGKACIGIYTYEKAKGLNMVFARNYREYAQVELTKTLLKDSLYHIGMSVTRSANADYATDAIGLHLSTIPVSTYRQTRLKVEPQISNVEGMILGKTSEWVLIDGCYKAQGGEKYLTIGNFNGNRETQLRRESNKYRDYAYYYIDDVFITPVSSHGCDSIKQVKSM